MRRILPLIVLCLAASALAAEPVKPQGAGEIAALVVKQLPAGWRCMNDRNCIVISRDEEVTILNHISLPARPVQDLLREFGWKDHYLMVLEFRPRLSDDEYARIAALRDAELKKIDDDPSLDGKEKYTSKREVVARYPLPSYFNDRFSIYVHRTDPSPLDVFPESAAKDRDAILAVLAQTMTAYPPPATK